ncbi:MAG: DUF418 domain-containing protein [Pseudomonadota bacterium]
MMQVKTDVMTPPDRALMPDYLRLIALFGIVIVNVQFIAFSALGSFTEPVGKTPLDAVVMWLVNGLALLKTYGLFSFMFGVGLGFLMRSAARRGLAFGQVYRNRMIGLLLLGILHGCLFFPGDILTIYAITGSVLYLMREWSVSRLCRTGVLLLVVQTIVAPPLALLGGETPADLVALERQLIGEGGFLSAIGFRSIGFAITMPVFLLIQGISALGWFCLGLAAVKSGMIDDADHPLWARARRWFLVPGVGLSLVAAAIWQWGDSMTGAALTIISAPLATVGYLGLIAAIARPPGPVMAAALAAGGSSLSIYLGQSIILTTIFAGYGLGLWEDVDRLTAVLTAVGVTVLLIIAVTLWRRRYALGPFEWLLRKITYAG